MRGINLLKNLGLLFVSLIFAFLVLEGVFRLVTFKPASVEKQGIATADERGQTVFRKNLDAEIISSETGEPVHVVTNSEGFIGPDYSVAKPENTIRIALLGDSFVEATQIDYEKTFAHLLEEELSSRNPDKRFEVLNFGVGGQGTMEELLRYHYYVQKYQPDLVTVFFYPNDFENNQYYLEYRDLIASNNPKWVNITQADANFSQSRKDFKYRILKTFRLVQYLDVKVRQNPVLEKIAVRLGLHNQGILGTPTGGIPSVFFIYQNPLPESHEIVYNFTDELLEFFRREVEENFARFLLVYLPEAKQVDTSLWEMVQKETPELSRFEWNLDQPNEFLAKTFASRGGLYLDLTAEFRKFIAANPESHLYLLKGEKYQGHLSDTGHIYLTEILTKYYAGISK